MKGPRNPEAAFAVKVLDISFAEVLKKHPAHIYVSQSGTSWLDWRVKDDGSIETFLDSHKNLASSVIVWGRTALEMNGRYQLK